MNNKTYWQNKEVIELSKSVIAARDISDGAKITLAFLLTYADRDEISISQGRIAEERGLSDGTINQHFLMLETNGYIILIRKSGKSSQIIFTDKTIPNNNDSEA